MAVAKARAGIRLRRFREQRGLTQAALAQALGISPSYVNQIESNQRPITAPVLFKLADVFDTDVQQFSTEPADRLVAELRDVLSDTSIGEPATLAELGELAAAMPGIARTLIEVHRRYRHGLEVNHGLAGLLDSDGVPPAMAYEEVRDLFYAHRNHFPRLDRAAERLSATAGLTAGDTATGLAAHLARRHGTTVVDLPGDDGGLKRRYDPRRRELAVSPLLHPGRRAFQLATHVALTEFTDEIDEVLAGTSLTSHETRSLARIGLANYAAGALILPYTPFRDAADELRYDIDLLRQRFRVGYETITHRLSTLQRPRARGVPFVFVRVDRAGNISKRQSATDFHFSRIGGSCALWNVYEAFAHPRQIHTQLAEMPDGRRYLWIARTVHHRTGGYHSPETTFAIGLGCDLRHAHKLVYADGLDLNDPTVLTPIGPGCKLCDRPACPQRAFPALGRPLHADPHQARSLPYATGEAPPPTDPAD